MPGVSTTTDVLTGAQGVAVPPSGTYFLAGLTERGPTGEAVAVRSVAEYVATYGDRVSYGRVFDDLQTFFAEGGARAYVARVVGADAEPATLTLDDRAVAPVDTLRIDALDAGAWGNSLTVQVANGGPANTFTITVRRDGDVVETFADLASPAAAVTALADSAYVRATNLASVTVAPNNNPAVLAATALATGDDDRTGLTGAEYAAAVDALFGVELGPGAVAIPGQPSSAVGTLLAAHASARRRVALLELADGTSVADAIDAGEAALAADFEGAEAAGLFYPWVMVPDGTGTRTIPPEGYVAGVRARAHSLEGPWRAPAGDLAKARWVLGLAEDLDRDDVDALHDAGVSPVRTIGAVPRLYGWRSLSPDLDNWRLLTGREVGNVLEAAAEDLLEAHVFATIDPAGRLLSRIEGELVGLLAPMARAGGLYPRVVGGEQVDPGYRVDMSANTAATLAANTVKATLAYRVSPTGELIEVTIVKAAVTVPL